MKHLPVIAVFQSFVKKPLLSLFYWLYNLRQLPFKTATPSIR